MLFPARYRFLPSFLRRPTASAIPPSTKRGQIFRTMPRASLVVLFAAIGFLFSAMGAVNDLFGLEHYDVPHLVLSVISSAVFSIAWAALGFLQLFRWMFPLALLQTLFYVLMARIIPRSTVFLGLEDIHLAVILHATLITIFIVLAYSFFIGFIRREGKRFFAAHTEIELASAIQRELVPRLSVKSARFEAYGLSLPSGAVGGDLLDIVSGSDASFAYVADVSGHGVKAGVLMSMIKASVRTRFAPTLSQVGDLLEVLNDVLYPLTDPQSYATLAFVVLAPGPTLQFSLAGHLPILHLEQASGIVRSCSVENFPVAMFPGARFTTSQLTVQPGDLIAIFTDGLTELANKRGEEIGTAYIEQAMREHSSQPLHAIADSILQTSQAFGSPVDDRTLLLIRVA